MMIPLVNPSRPAGAGLTNKQKETSMIIRKSRKAKSTKARRAKRRNPSKVFAGMSFPKRVRKKARKTTAKATTRRKRRTTATGKRVRPTLYKRGGKFYAPRKTRRPSLLKRGTRINPRKRRVRRYRRNPVAMFKSLIDTKKIITAFSLAGGFVSGTLLMPVVSNIVPITARASVDKYLGVAHILLGGLVAMAGSRGKKPNAILVSLGGGLAVSGAYDLMAQFAPPAWGIATLPRAGGPLVKLLPASAMDSTMAKVSASYAVAHRPISRVAGQGTGMGLSYYGASYETMGNSYSGGSGDPYRETGVFDS